MTDDINLYLLIYLAGCAASFCIGIFNYILTWLFLFITNLNILKNNLKKIEKPSVLIGSEEKGIIFVLWLLGIAISWIGFISSAWCLFKIIQDILNQIFISKPESVKRLLYVLKTNKEMTRESIWAYFTALSVEVGGFTDPSKLTDSLKDIKFEYSRFNMELALEHLKTLKLVDECIILETLNTVRRNE